MAVDNHDYKIICVQKLRARLRFVALKTGDKTPAAHIK